MPPGVNDATEERWRQIRSALVSKYGSLRGAFDAFNTRRSDSRLDVTEWKNGLAQVGVCAQEASALLSALDDDYSGGVELDEFQKVLEARVRDEAVQTDSEKADYLASVVQQAKAKQFRHLTRAEALKRRTIENHEFGQRFYVCSSAATLLRLCRSWASRFRFFWSSERAARARVAALECDARELICLTVMHSAVGRWQTEELVLLDREATAVEEDTASIRLTVAQHPPAHKLCARTGTEIEIGGGDTINAYLDQLRSTCATGEGDSSGGA